MKRFTKALLCSTVALILGTGSVFAKGKNGMNRNLRNVKPQRIHSQNFSEQKMTLLGQISAIDTENSSIKIKDADGKENIISIIPFTRILISNSKDQNEITDLKAGDWIMYSLFNTETEKKIANRIIVKKN